jgi:hypothetical protein
LACPNAIIFPINKKSEAGSGLRHIFKAGKDYFPILSRQTPPLFEKGLFDESLRPAQSV